MFAWFAGRVFPPVGAQPILTLWKTPDRLGEGLGPGEKPPYALLTSYEKKVPDLKCLFLGFQINHWQSTVTYTVYAMRWKEYLNKTRPFFRAFGETYNYDSCLKWSFNTDKYECVIKI